MEGAEWVGRGFWSRLVRPVPPLLSHPEPGSGHSRHRAGIHTWSRRKTKQGRAAGLQAKRDTWGLYPARTSALPPPQPGVRSLSHLVSK